MSRPPAVIAMTSLRYRAAANVGDRLSPGGHTSAGSVRILRKSRRRGELQVEGAADAGRLFEAGDLFVMTKIDSGLRDLLRFSKIGSRADLITSKERHERSDRCSPGTQSRPDAVTNCGAGRGDDGRLPPGGVEPTRTIRGAGHGGQRLLRREGPGSGRSVGARVVDDPIAAINDPEVDAVLIASPGAAHQAQVSACLDAGRPVLCEKPLTTDVGIGVRDRAAGGALRRTVDPGRLHASLRSGVRRAQGSDHVGRVSATR